MKCRVLSNSGSGPCEISLRESRLDGDLDGDDMGNREVDRSNFEELLGGESISVRSP